MSSFLLAEVLKSPARLSTLSLGEWNVLIRQARYSSLLARLHQLAQGAIIDPKILARVEPHMHSAQVIANKQLDGLKCEKVKLLAAFAELEVPLVFLKGAAYFALGLPFARSRLLSDIDLLVPGNSLPDVESLLVRHGWVSAPKDDYDERYYREWMHEIPPLRHDRRRSVLDIHHTILPPTAKYHPDPGKIIAATREISPGLRVPCPEDLVIHSATHLFHEGELEHGLRSVVDLHELLNHFGKHEPGFWDRLVPRAIELDLVRPLYYGLHYARLILETSVPEEVIADARAGQPNRLLSKIMDFLFVRALSPDHPSCDRPFTGLSRWLLYIRSHYLRMPLYLLLPHLVRKAWKRRFEKPEALVPAAAEEKRA